MAAAGRGSDDSDLRRLLRIAEVQKDAGSDDIGRMQNKGKEKADAGPVKKKVETRRKRKLGESSKVGEVLGQPKKKKVVAEERNEGDGDETKEQFRSTFPNFRSYNSNIPQGVIDLMKKTPFALIFEALHKDLVNGAKSNQLLGMVLEAYNYESNVFTFGGKTFKIRTSDVSCILGLNKRGNCILKKAGEPSDFVTGFFGREAKVSKDAVLKSIQDELKKQPEDDDQRRIRDANVARLIIVDILVKLLLPNAAGNLNINYVRAVEDLDDIGSYSWAREVNLFLKDRLKGYKKSTSKSKNIGGCVHVILYWICMKTKMVKPIPGRNKEKHLMRKWDLSQLLTAMKKCDISKKFANVEEDLEESSDEEPEEDEAEEEEPEHEAQTKELSVEQTDNQGRIKDLENCLREKEEKRAMLSEELEATRRENQQLKAELEATRRENQQLKAELEKHNKVEKVAEETSKLTADLSCPQEADPSLQPSLSHLSSKPDTEVVPIGGQGILQIPNFLPERSLLNCPKKKLLILDINGLLADIVEMKSIPRHFKPDKIISQKAVFKRPFCDSFLQFCFDKFNVGVWSSRNKKNVDLVMDTLFGPSKEKLLFCWNQSHCTPTRYNTLENTEKPLVLKELRKLWEKLEPNLPWARGEYNETNTVLVDDSPYKALRNPVNTAIFPFPYQYREEDSSLGPEGKICSYLQGLAGADSVQKYVQQNPFGQKPITESDRDWKFYRQVIEDIKPLT